MEHESMCTAFLGQDVVAEGPLERVAPVAAGTRRAGLQRRHRAGHRPL